MKKLVFLSAAWLTLSVLPADGQIKFPGMGKGDKQEREAKEKEEAAVQKNRIKFEELRNYSRRKYQSDPDFRDEVDQSFNDLQRDHADRAFEKNTNRASYIQSIHEDNWRVHVHLYDNLRVQDHVNRLGQKLVPAGSDKLYAYKVIPDPIPSAETLSTGTIYMSTGLISLLDSETQLAYVLAHEMSHVYLDHWRERVMMAEGAEAYAAEQDRKVKRWTLFGSMAGAAAGAAIGGAVGGGSGALAGLGIGAGAGALAGLIAGATLNKPLIVDWDRAEEDEADEMALKALLNMDYDVREVPKLYIAMENAVTRDVRVGLGFIGNRRRVGQRREKAEDLIKNALAAEIQTRGQKGFTPESPEHQNLMAELKRDNGIMAYYHDMFEMARTNLGQAAAIRDNDPAVHFFYGKVLKLVGRSDDERRLASQEFDKAVQTDYRKQNYGAHLHKALMMLEDQSERKTALNKETFVSAVDSYVTDYAQWNYEHGQLRMFPPNLESIYDYMRLYGDPGWRPKPPDLTRMVDYSVYYNANPGLIQQHPLAKPVADKSPGANAPKSSKGGAVYDASKTAVCITPAQKASAACMAINAAEASNKQGQQSGQTMKDATSNTKR